MGASDPLAIGGDFCRDPVDASLIPGDGHALTDAERESLWQLFQAIGSAWDDVRFENNTRSSWLEFIEAKTTEAPSYAGEYANAVGVVQELIEIHGAENAYALLFFRSGVVPNAPPTTRLAHAKRYVVDEFIRVNIVASGFKAFGGKNYNGYIAGSRYNRFPKVRAQKPAGGQP